MNNLILASTSTLFGQSYLSYLLPELKSFFKGAKRLTFVPFARPGGCSEQEYTQKVRQTLAQINIEVVGLNETNDAPGLLSESSAIFTGGGNTFLLLKKLWDLNLIDPLTRTLDQGVPYLGTSAGSNICGLGIHTTNDMPIVHPPTLKALGRVPCNINAHYIEPEKNSTHMGESRATRIKEFQYQEKIPVVGLPEGSWLRVAGAEMRIEGSHPAVLFYPDNKKERINVGSPLILPKMAL